MSDLIGTTLDKYELIRLLGEGGMGAVYEGRHSLIKKRCAVKVLHPQFAQDESLVKRLLQEAQAAAAIGHPNIVETFDFGLTDDGVCFLVMELLKGESLASMIQRFGQLGIEQAVAVAVQVLSSLAAAHKVNIVHRDLKPENVFIARASLGGEMVKLLDFGISRFASDDGSPRLTRTGAIMGTPYYMSPEQARGAKNLDKRTDLWSLGVILYECLTGTVPFEGDNYNEIIVRIATKDIRPPLELNALIPDALNDLVMKALHKKMDQRFVTATEMIGALMPFYDRTRSEAGRYVLRSQFLETNPGLKSGLSEARAKMHAPPAETALAPSSPAKPAGGTAPEDAEPPEALAPADAAKAASKADEASKTETASKAEEAEEAKEAKEAKADKGEAAVPVMPQLATYSGPTPRISMPPRETALYGAEPSASKPVADPAEAQEVAEAGAPEETAETEAPEEATGTEDPEKAQAVGELEEAATTAVFVRSEVLGQAAAATPRKLDVGNATMAPGQVVGRDSGLWRATRPPVIIGAAIGVVVLGVVLLLVLRKGDKPEASKGSSGTDTSSASGGDADAAPEAPAMPAEPPMARLPTMRSAPDAMRGEITVRLKGLPPGATIKLDGATVTAPLSLVPDGKRHRLLVRAPGYWRYRKRFRATKKLKSLRLRMRRTRRAPMPAVRVAAMRRRVPPMRRSSMKTMEGLYRSPFD